MYSDEVRDVSLTIPFKRILTNLTLNSQLNKNNSKL